MERSTQRICTNSETQTSPGIQHHIRGCQPDNRLEIAVIFTDTECTLCALKILGGLASGLETRIRIIVPQVVHYALPLDKPAVSEEFTERHFSTLASNSSIETRIDICLCRRREEGLLQALKPHSLVIIGSKPSLWWMGRGKLANLLARNGHQVVMIPCSKQ